MKNKQSVSQQLKKAGIKGGIAIRRGEWAGESRPKHVPGADKVRPKGKAPLTLPKETLVMMAKDKSSGIMTQRLIDLDKHTSNQPPDMDLNELAEVGKFLREIRTEVMPLTDADAPIIDISGNHPED
jgi:hypothetical protein